MRGRLAATLSPSIRHRLTQLLVDACLVALAYFLAFVLRFDGPVPFKFRELLEQTIVFVVVGKLAIFGAFGLYHKWWRYVGLRDLTGILKAVTTGSLLLLGVLYLLAPTGIQIPRSVAAMDYLLTLLLILGVRVGVRSIVERPSRGSLVPHGRETLVVGAGEGGQAIVREMVKNGSLGATPVGFVDDDPRKQGIRIGGFKVLGTTDELDRVLEEVEPADVIIAIPSAPGVLRQKVVSACRRRDIRVRTLPTVFQLLQDSVDLARQIREVEVEDVLGREPVRVKIDRVGKYLCDRTVMVTGAGGSIGSELCRQIARVGAAKLVLVDNSEGALYDIEQELVETRHFRAIEPVLADCRDSGRMKSVFARHRPSVVFHAAAYKHVPLMEANPIEAVRNNAFGTQNVAHIAGDYGVEEFVLVSTDKAVRPQTAMGASKAMAEWSVEAAGQLYPGTRFAAVRFGNVLGSRGSVIHVFRRQIASGGPVTVTHPEMTRYFMTIPEAVQLIIQAGGMVPEGGSGTGLYVLEMGEPVSIMELATNMIRLSGHVPGTDIAIEVVGPRAGEKLHEELFGDDERLVPTDADKIMSARRAQIDVEWVERSFLELDALASDEDERAFTGRVAELAAERSRTSVPA